MASKKKVRPKSRKVRRAKKKKGIDIRVIGVLVMILAGILVISYMIIPSAGPVQVKNNATMHTNIPTTQVTESPPSVSVNFYYDGHKVSSITTNKMTVKIIAKTIPGVQFSLYDKAVVTKFRDFTLSVKQNSSGVYVLTLEKKYHVDETIDIVAIYNGQPVAVLPVTFKFGQSSAVQDVLNITVEGSKNGVVHVSNSFTLDVVNEMSISTVVNSIQVLINNTQVPVKYPVSTLIPPKGSVRIPVMFEYPLSPGVYGAKIIVTTSRSSFTIPVTLVVQPEFSQTSELLSPAPVIWTGMNKPENGLITLEILSNAYYPNAYFMVYPVPEPDTGAFTVKIPARTIELGNEVLYYATVPLSDSKKLLDYAGKYPDNPVIITISNDMGVYSVHVIKAISLFTGVGVRVSKDAKALPVTLNVTGEYNYEFRAPKNVTEVVVRAVHTDGSAQVTKFNGNTVSGNLYSVKEIDFVFKAGGRLYDYYLINPASVRLSRIINYNGVVYFSFINPYTVVASYQYSIDNRPAGSGSVGPESVKLVKVMDYDMLKGSITLSYYVGSKEFLTIATPGLPDNITLVSAGAYVVANEPEELAGKPSIFIMNTILSPTDSEVGQYTYIHSANVSLDNKYPALPSVAIGYYIMSILGVKLNYGWPVAYYFKDGIIAVVVVPNNNISEYDVFANVPLENGKKEVKVYPLEVGKTTIKINGETVFVIG